MKSETKKELLNKTDELLAYLDTMHCGEHVSFTEDEVQTILEQEREQAQENYNRGIEAFLKENDSAETSNVQRFVVYFGYPGAGKSVMTQHLIDRFAKEEDCLPFHIIDKDQHRNLFPNLFNHLKGGHIDECEKFAGVTIDYVRQILDLSLQSGQRSVLSVGSMGAGVEFADNATKAINHGYKPCAAYMAVNPDIAYLSSVYRSATLYDQIIFQNHELYPRLVSNEYFSRVVQMLPEMIDKISVFQQNNAQDVDLIVVNRANEILYDTRRPHLNNVQEVIAVEENRPLRTDEIITIHQQLHKIQQNMQYRYENGVYVPCRSEVDMAKTAVSNIAGLIRRQPNENTLSPYILQQQQGKAL